MTYKFKPGDIVRYIGDSDLYRNKFVKIIEINKNYYYYYVETLFHGIRFYTFTNEIRKLATEEKLELL